ncbi:MAG: hypothetical protein HIU93_05880 [Acidobacteria bacterium]|uniref:Uncharacterized protein n=1 Tax=Acidipila rosea TaxID=768535 RepID=A0A4R1L9Z0_9BACT|nr:hypothetical protein [Acidobacteriota bacterium]TCK75198.1 hypothetical protein C7378_0178 [Acidipila rosea]
MRQFLILCLLLLCSLPVGLSIAGCGANPNNYCVRNNHGYGLKIGQVANIDLEPKTTGISLAYGQTGQVQQPTATDCVGTTETIAHYNYGSSNLLLADINPNTGQICGGTWNRNSAGGIPDFTICIPPSGPGVAQITASGAGVSSNPIPVFVHPPISTITIPDQTQTGCVPQNQQLPSSLLAGTTVLDQSGNPINLNYVGNITYAAVNPSIVSISQTTGTNGVATALQPGSTVITATTSLVTSAAGYFFTCPPANISLTVNGHTGANGNPIVVSPSSPQNISAAITDAKGQAINGPSLDYSSTQPQQISVSAGGAISALFPTTGDIQAICQPGTCNPAPVNKIGVLGTGLPIVSDKLVVKSTGSSSTLLWMASPQSNFFTPIDLTNGNVGTPVKLPYQPNSMVMDQLGLNIYFGSYRELMVVAAASNSLSKQDINVPGVVLAVSPDGTTVVINDRVRNVIYLYTAKNGSFTSIGGTATSAVFSPDSKNLYIAGPNALYVHNISTGWSVYPETTYSSGPACTLDNSNLDPFCSPGVAITIPSVGPFISGSSTTANGFCPDTRGATPIYYPNAATVAAQTDQLAATNDGNHIIGATIGSGGQLTDIAVTIPQSTSVAGNTFPGSCPQSNNHSLPLTIPTTFNQIALGVSPTNIDQVVTSPDSALAFVTYNSSNATGVLPVYKPATPATTPGTISDVQLSSGALAPLAGVFSPDGSIFFVGTSGDNLVHYVDVKSLTDTQTINPKLVDPNGNPVPVQFLVVKPRPTT